MMQQRANHSDPPRDGSEKTKSFLVGRGLQSHHRYKRSVARGIPHRALIRKGLGFFGHVTWQASGWREGEAVERDGRTQDDTNAKGFP
jgi:hypothetical protein